ncbi:MAG: metallophosphoesterase, partial [Candidatus Binataceae bacterium]
MSSRKQKLAGRLFAIGDIHGCPDELDAILKAIAPVAGDTVVFVGDYVDRGPSARDVIEIAMAVEKSGAEGVFLKGNHEDMMLSYLGLPGNYGESFLFNGGVATLESYGVREDDLAEAVHHIPAAHLE